MDIIDVAQQRQQDEIDHALAAASRARQAELPIRTHCVVASCGEPISPVRQQMRAQRCIDCQRDAEHVRKSWARGGI